MLASTGVIFQPELQVETISTRLLPLPSIEFSKALRRAFFALRIAGIAMPGYTKKANRWVVGAEYLLKNYDYRGTSVPRAQFTAEGGYYLKFLSDPTKTFFLSIGGSALVGYETVNWGDKMLYDGSTLLAKDAFIYGGAITPELESYITDRIVLLANVRERVLWGGSLGKFSTQFGLGVKFIIN